MKYIDYNENKTHGTNDFPIQFYHLTEYDSRYVMTLHRHKEFEIIRIIDGNFTINIDNSVFDLNKGDIAMINCNSLHRGEPKNCIYECVVFDINMLRKHHNDIISKNLLPIINNTVSVNNIYKAYKDKEISVIINELFDEMKKEEEYYQFSVFISLYKIFMCLYKNNYIDKNILDIHNVKQTKILTDLLDFIEVNYTKQITLSDLSEISGLNEKYLCKFFKDYTEQTPISYINSVRIECACHELRENHLSVTEAALESGFNDLSYFTKVFKKLKGKTPKCYKESEIV